MITGVLLVPQPDDGGDLPVIVARKFSSDVKPNDPFGLNMDYIDAKTLTTKRILFFPLCEPLRQTRVVTMPHPDQEDSLLGLLILGL